MTILLSSSTKLSALLLAVSLCNSLVQSAAIGSEPTKGFVPVHMNWFNFDIHRPYDMTRGERYSFKDGIHKLMDSKNQPQTLRSNTWPRMEIRIRGYDYSSGAWQFEGHGYVPKGMSGVSVMQVFGATGHATTTMIRVYNSSLHYYRDNLLSRDIYDRWFKLNMIHDVEASQLKIHVDDEFKLATRGDGGNNHFLKCGFCWSFS